MTRAITIASVLITVGLASMAISRGNLVIGMLAVGPLLLVATSAAGAGRVASRSGHLKSRAASLRIWGAAPRQFGDSELFVERVWALGAGLHFNVVKRNSAGSVHIKVAQPRRWSIDENALTIGDAKYIQVSGAAVERVAGQAAMELLLKPRERSL
jgi:hypothetical protein